MLWGFAHCVKCQYQFNVRETSSGSVGYMPSYSWSQVTVERGSQTSLYFHLFHEKEKNRKVTGHWAELGGVLRYITFLFIPIWETFLPLLRVDIRGRNNVFMFGVVRLSNFSITKYTSKVECLWISGPISYVTELYEAV